VRNRFAFGCSIIGLLLTSVAAVEGGYSWWLFGTVPLIAVGAWMFVREGVAAPR
jgi:uncharacterized membrane protein